MKLIKLHNEAYINPELVASVRLNSTYSSIAVRMQDGDEHYLQSEYHKSIWETYERIIKLINGEE